MKRFVFTKSRLIGFCCCVLLPIAAISLGILMLFNDFMLDIGFAIVYFLIPVIAAGLLACCIFSNCKTWKKSIISGAILLLFLIVFFISSFLAGWTLVMRYEGDEAVQQYSLLESELMPDLTELDKPTHIEYYHLLSYFYIFFSETDGLICSYTPEDYEIQKARLAIAYTFQTEPIINDFSNYEPVVDIDGYRFRMLSYEEYDLFHPKTVVLVGYSDDTNEIVYLKFHDTDLDFITSLKDFIMDECGWKYIR